CVICVLFCVSVSSSSSQTEISAGSSVTLSCQLYSYSYTGVSCYDWIRSEGIDLLWVNQADDKLKISDSRYQISAPGHCIITLTTTLLNEDDSREWRCEVTHRDQVKASATYTVKFSGKKTISSSLFTLSANISEQTDDVTYTEVTVNRKNSGKKNKVRCDDKMTYSAIRGAEAGAQENCSQLYASVNKNHHKSNN
ncbi:hypothetical protein QQF64_025891, partial [Cirrhinus molitorella]